jgi:hypothetical protein
MNLVERFFGDLTAFISEKSFASPRNCTPLDRTRA